MPDNLTVERDIDQDITLRGYGLSMARQPAPALGFSRAGGLDILTITDVRPLDIGQDIAAHGMSCPMQNLNTGAGCAHVGVGHQAGHDQDITHPPYRGGDVLAGQVAR